jgi:hypothetical protein
MAFVNQYKSFVAKASTGWAGAAGQTINTSALVYNDADKICCKLLVTLTTANVTATLKWQASDDGSTWVDVKDWNNAAYVALTAASGANNIWLCAPANLAAKFVRVQGLTAGAGTAVVTDDLFQADWKILKKDF